MKTRAFLLTFSAIAIFLQSQTANAEVTLRELGQKIELDKVETMASIFRSFYPNGPSEPDIFFFQGGQIHARLAGPSARKEALRKFLSNHPRIVLKKRSSLNEWKDTGLTIQDFSTISGISYKAECVELKQMEFLSFFAMDFTNRIPYIELQVNKSKLNEFTRSLLGKTIGIFIEDELIAAPQVLGPVMDGIVRLDGNYSSTQMSKILSDIQNRRNSVQFKVLDQDKWLPTSLNSNDILSARIVPPDEISHCESLIAAIQVNPNALKTLRTSIAQNLSYGQWAFFVNDSKLFDVYPITTDGWTGLIQGFGNSTTFLAFQRNWVRLSEYQPISIKYLEE